MYHEDKPLLRREVLSEEFLMSILDHQYYLVGTTCQYIHGSYGNALMNAPIYCSYCTVELTFGGSRLIGVCDGCIDEVLKNYTKNVTEEKEAIDKRWDSKGSDFRGCITCYETSLTTTYYDLCPTGKCKYVVCRDCLTDNIRICMRTFTPLKCYVCKTKCGSYDDIPRATDIEMNIYNSRYTELVKYILHHPIDIVQYQQDWISTLVEYCGCCVLNKKTIGDYIVDDKNVTWRENSSFFINTDAEKLEHTYCTSFCNHGDISIKFMAVDFKYRKDTYQKLVNHAAVTSHCNFKLTYDLLFVSCIARLEYRIKYKMENDEDTDLISLINDVVYNEDTSDITQIDLSEIYFSDIDDE